MSDKDLIKELKAKLAIYESNPFLVESYEAICYQLSSWNDQLKKQPIDLFAESTQKEFDRAFKFFAEIDTIYDTLDRLRSRMSPQEQTDVENKRLGSIHDLRKADVLKKND